jgi:hypothetical protein
VKISNREKTLLAILVVIVFGYLFLNYAIKPLKEKISVLNTEVEAKTIELHKIDKLIEQEEFYNKSYDSYNEKLINYSNKYYSSLNQEEILLILNRFNVGEEFLVNNFKFNNKQGDDGRVEDLVVEFNYMGPYLELYDYIDAINNSDKYIIIKDLDIESKNDNIVSGTMEVDFSSIPAIKSYVNDKSFFEKYGDLVDKQTNSPYIPYASLAQKIAENSKTSADELSKIELYLKNRVVKPVIGFDNSDTFFVGNDVDIIANITKTEKRLYGSNAIEFSYNFGMKKPENRANLAFEDELLINEQSEYLSLWVYSNEVTGHQIGVVLVDSIGESYDLVLTSNVDFKEWKALEVEIPIEVNYPCKVQRIYTENTDYDQRLNGTLIFDQLQTADVKELD